MRTLTIFLLTGLLILSCNKRGMELNELKSKIENKFKNVEGDFGFAFREIGNPENQILINEQEVFHAASTMKTPVLIEVFRQVEAGKFSLDDSILVENNFKSIVDGSSYQMDITRDSGDALYDLLGKKTTIYNLVYDMITVSSNLATNIVIEIVDAEKVTETMRKLGAEKIQVLRGVEDMKAFDAGLNNSTTAFDMMLIFESIANCKMVNDTSCKEMIKILSDQKFNSVIPSLLPDDVVTAHKTGSIDGVQHDTGLVFLPNGKKYAIIFLSKNLVERRPAITAMAEISKMIYDYMN
ncbi:MAG: serine hydrolase [Ignavibacteriae bacterium]|nr:serine hydrolase [Ignavibacteriota bacterium]NOG99617.1 serine hydrolase [Ignavibacteriota bacterium]